MTEGDPRAPGPPEGGAAVVPAALAALAEAGVLFLPIELAAKNASLPARGPLFWYPMFAVLFAVGVALAAAWRGRRWMPAFAAAGAVAVGALQAVTWGVSGAWALLAVGLCMAAGIRVVTLGLRDWRDPIDASFGWGAGALIVEIAFAPVAHWDRVMLAAVVVVFFAGSLASRAASLRLAERATRGTEARATGAGRRWRLVGASLALSVLLTVGAGWFFGTAHGPVGAVTSLVLRLFAWLLYGAAILVALLLTPVVWLLERIGVNARNLQTIARRLGRSLRHTFEGGFSGRAGHLPAWERLIGLFAVVLVIAGLLWLILRQRRRAREAVLDRTRWLTEEEEAPRRAAPEARPRGRRRRRHELPEDSVRRLYAQALIALEKRGRPRPKALTPGEFLRRTARDLPECAPGLTVLTRAYEDVRYGRRVLDTVRVDSLEAEWAVLSKAIRSASPPSGRDGEETPDDRAGRLEEADRSAPSTDATFGRR